MRSAHRPLAPAGEYVLTYCGGSLHLCDQKLRLVRSLGRLPRSATQRVATRGSLARRALRLDPTDAVAVDESTMLVNARGRIWRVDLVSGEVNLDFSIPGGRKALRLHRVTGVSGFPDAVMFGEYCSNPDQASLRLWRRAMGAEGGWTTAHVFPSGTANHIHDVVPDPYRGCLWVLTGDFDDAPAIWRLTASGEAQPLFRGSQQDRAAVMCVAPDALYYGTDTPLEPNYLYRVDLSGERPVRTQLSQLPGSVIYGVTTNAGFVFSTTVEPGRPTGRRWRDWISRRPGPGILDSRAYLFLMEFDGKLTELRSAEKDALPMVLFQFGTYFLCQDPAGGAYAYPVALRQRRPIHIASNRDETA